MGKISDLMFKINARAKILANEKMTYLRIANSVNATSLSGMQAESKHLNRGELIELILESEFEDDAAKLDDELGFATDDSKRLSDLIEKGMVER